MSISGIGGAVSSINYYDRGKRSSNQVADSFHTGTGITLRMTNDDSGNEALTSVGFPDGGTISVFQVEDDSNNNFQYIVKYWDKSGEETEYIVNPTQVNPENASYVEMVAYATYLDVFGQTSNAFGNFLSASRGVNGDLVYDAENMKIKMDFKFLVNDFMQAQYDAGNITGYLSYKQFYDCMESKSENLTKQDYRKLISEKKYEIYEKLKNGDTEPSYQIGGSSFTEKEWDKLLENVDDILEEIREEMREEHQKRFEEMLEKEQIEDAKRAEDVDNIAKIFGSASTNLEMSDFKEYETVNYKVVPCNDGVYSYFNIYKNGENAGAFFYSDICIKRDSITGTEVLLSEHGTGAGMYNVIPMDEELKQALKAAMGVDELPTEELSGYSIKTHLETGIQCVMKNGAEGRGGTPLLRSQRDIEKYNELTQTYMDKYPNLVTSQGMAEMYASFEICGCMHRTETGIMKVFCDGISYNDNHDYKKNWAAKFDDATWDLLYEWLEEHQNRANDFDKFQSWADILDEIGGTCERIWSDEELDQGYLNN